MLSKEFSVSRTSARDMLHALMTIKRYDNFKRMFDPLPEPYREEEYERKKGRWIVKEKGCKLTSYKCSECGRYIADDTGYDVKKDYPFCHCGADMREDTDEGQLDFQTGVM